jgi:predicted transcriptional regulator
MNMQIESIIEKVVGDISTRFGIFLDSKEMEVYPTDSMFADSSSRRIRAIEKSVFIPKDYNVSDYWMQAEIARELFLENVFASVIEKKEQLDVAYEYGRQWLPKNIQPDWEREWALDSPDTILSTGLRYRPRVFFKILWELDEQQPLCILATRLLKMELHGIHLGYEEWVEFLVRFTTNYERPLTFTEKIVIKHLVMEPNSTLDTIAKRTGKTKKWISETRSKLMRRGQLLEFMNISYQIIGIRVFHVTLIPEDHQIRSCEYLLDNCPFLFSKASVFLGKKGILATLCIPDNPKNLEYLKKLNRIAKRDGVNFFVIERYRHNEILSLNDYSEISGKWEIDWESIRMETYMMQNELLAKLYPEMSVSYTTKMKKLDWLDIRLLSEYEKGMRTVKQLQKALGVRIGSVSEKLNNLKKEGVIIRNYEVHHIGLVEECAVYTDVKEVGECISAVGLRLPRCFIDYDQNNRLFMRLRLPSGGSYGLSKSLNPLYPYPTIQLVGDRIWGHWRLAEWLDCWNENTGGWKPLENEPSDWLESMESMR